MTVTSGDHWVATEHGRLFARTWVPSDQRGDRNAAILLFHDSLGCVDLWRDFPHQLAAATARPVIAYDRLGFGLSDPQPDPLPPTFIRDEAVHVVPRLLDALGVGALIPFGHSVGGAMAVAAAACFEERCVAVVTEAAQSFVEARTLSGIRAAQIAFQRPGELDRLARYHGRKARSVLDAWIATWLAPSFAAWCLDHDLRAVHCPILALHGDRDEYGSLEHPERIARLAQGPTQTVIMKEVGHVPHREQPARVLDEVARFLAGIPR